jgi:hypothetical protein
MVSLHRYYPPTFDLNLSNDRNVAASPSSKSYIGRIALAIPDDAQSDSEFLIQTRTLLDPALQATIQSILGVGSDGMTTFLMHEDDEFGGTSCEY